MNLNEKYAFLWYNHEKYIPKYVWFELYSGKWIAIRYFFTQLFLNIGKDFKQTMRSNHSMWNIECDHDLSYDSKDSIKWFDQVE